VTKILEMSEFKIKNFPRTRCFRRSSFQPNCGKQSVDLSNGPLIIKIGWCGSIFLGCVGLIPSPFLYSGQRNQPTFVAFNHPFSGSNFESIYDFETHIQVLDSYNFKGVSWEMSSLEPT